MIGPIIPRAAVSVGLLLCASPLAAQSMGDASRLTGIDRVQIRAEAEWDEGITMSAGGATPDQFLQALNETFAASIEGAAVAPDVQDGAPVTVTCHVDTFYETGLIVYSLRAQVEVMGDDGVSLVRWIDSWVGSFTVQQLHLMFTLGEQCAESFLESWRTVN